MRTSAGDQGNTTTMLHMYRRDEHLSDSGFGGPPLPSGMVLGEWRGRTDNQPWFVMACAGPAVNRVVATTDRGTEVELALSEAVRIYGIRYAVDDLPRGQGPVSIRAEVEVKVEVTVVDSRARPTPAVPSGTAGAGRSSDRV